MTDINDKNINIEHINKAKKRIKPSESSLNKEINSDEQVNLDLANFSSSQYSAIIGRSQVSFKSKASMDADMKMFVENPALAQKANALFDLAYNAQKEKDYAKACEIPYWFYNEFK